MDGKRIVYCGFATSGDIWSTTVSANGNATNDNPIQLAQGKNTRKTYPVFSPDGKKIAYTVFTIGATTQIWMMDSDGKDQKQLTTGMGSFPRWFPDGNSIAFFSQRENRTGIWSVTIDGKETKLFDFDEDIPFARMSPNGKQVAFNSEKNGVLNIQVISIEGKETKPLTFDNELMGFPVWSPDGKWIAFMIKRGEDTHVGVIPSEGGEPIQLTFDKGQSLAYDWLADNDKILFAGQRDGLWNIYWVSRSTKEVKKLTNFTKLNAYVRYPTWSPLNTQIVYEYAETTGNIWMIELK